jgi:hypothetical protein
MTLGDGQPSAGHHGHRPSLISIEPLSIRTPHRTNFDLPSPQVPSAAQGSWI